MPNAELAPAPAAASRMRSISGSLMNGMIGETLTPTGTPARASASTVLQPPVRRRSARLEDAGELPGRAR